MNVSPNNFISSTDIKTQNTYILKKLISKRNLTNKEISEVITNIIKGKCSDIFISAFLISLLIKGENLEEIKGVVEAIQNNAVHISPIVNVPIMDNCGTGGDLLNTFNISTASAIVASSCGKVVVAKHGNRSSSSLSGSADFFEYLGYNLENEPQVVNQAIETNGFGFIYAPKFHPGLKNVSKVRRELGLRTVFNKIGPLCNPCTNLYGQIIGVSDPVLLDIVAQMTPLLGLKSVMIVYSHEGMDELSTSCNNTIVHTFLQDGSYSIVKSILDPSKIGLPKSTLKDISVKDTSQSILETLRVIYGTNSNPFKENIVLLNSSAILLNGNIVNSLEEGICIARECIHNGNAQKKLFNLIKSCGNISKLESVEKLI